MKILLLTLFNLLFLFPTEQTLLFFCTYPADPGVLITAFEGVKTPKRIDQLLREDRKKWLEYLRRIEMEESEDCP